MAIIRAAAAGKRHRIPDDVVDRVKDRADENIVEVVSESVALRKAGGHYVGLCPFHSEKTPSFNVVPGKGFFHCHGCGAHGKAVEFVQRYFGLSFPAAIRDLAARFGVAIPADGDASQTSRPAHTPVRRAPAPVAEDAIPEVPPQRRAALSAVLETALEFYRAPAQDVAHALVAWADKRSLEPDALERFEIGIAPNSWQGLRSAFGESYDDQVLLDVDLCRESENPPGRRYDTFRDRIIFPVRDASGALVGFGGRRLQDPPESDTAARTPKYLNTGATEIFHKGHLLYGLHQARESIVDRGYALVVEGYMDVVMMSQYGFPNTVASMGTAFRKSHLNLLREYTSEVVYLFDGDAAGQRAMWKALRESLPYADRINFRFISLKDQDPDEWVRDAGPATVMEAISTAESLAAFFLRRASELVEEASQEALATAQDKEVKQRQAYAAPDLKREIKELVSLIPANSSLRRYIAQEVHELLNPPVTQSAPETSLPPSDLDLLPADQRLTLAAMLLPETATNARSALLALLPAGHAESHRIVALYDKGIAMGRREPRDRFSTHDFAWARVTLTNTPELITELLAAASDCERSLQVARQRASPSQ